MRKSFWGICLALVAAIVLLAVFIPSCTGGTTGTINVNATLCGNPWPTQGGIGAVNYTLTLAGGTSPIAGTAVPTTHSGVAPGTWTCAYVSGGPPGAYLVNITASATQGVSAGGTITFTLNFELNQDAWIEFLPLTWTLSGEPVQGSEILAVPCNVIDVHFQQGVNGCEGYPVAVNETSWLRITQVLGPQPVTIHVINDGCALNKTPEPPHKFDQVPSFNGNPVLKGASIMLNPQQFVDLDVETAWQLVKETDYIKSINWLGISVFEPMPHACVLFELVLPGPGPYQFTLQTRAVVELVDDEDVNTLNNDTGWSAPVTLMVP